MRKFKIGDRVKQEIVGMGTVVAVRNGKACPISVKFDDMTPAISFKSDGKLSWTDFQRYAINHVFAEKYGSPDARRIVAMLAIEMRHQRRHEYHSTYAGDFSESVYLAAKGLLKSGGKND